MLAIPNFTIPFVIEVDASAQGVGAVLTQNKHPIAYFSKALGPHGQAKSIYEKELMAIVLAVQKWRHYLIGRHFVVWTDQRSLRFILEQREIGTDYRKWVSKLLGNDFEVRFKPGITNKAIDAFSRHLQFMAIHFNAITASSCTVDWSVLRQELEKDVTLQRLKKELENNGGEIAGYYVHHNQLLYKGRIVIPKDSTHG